MRIAVDIPKLKYRLLENRADAEGSTVQELVMRGIDMVLVEEKAQRRRRLKLPLIKSAHPGTLEMDSERIYGIIGFP